MQHFAVGWLVIQLAVREGHPERGALYLGLVGLARFVPTLALGLVAGVAVDRSDRSRVLLGTRAASALAVGLLAALTITDQVNIALVMVATLLLGSVFAFDNPARLAMTPSLVPPRDVLGAIGLIRATLQSAIVLGPLLGGLLIGPLGLGGLMVLNTIVFTVSGLGLRGLGRSRAADRPPGPRPLESVRQGLAYCWSQPTLRAFLVAAFVMNVLASSFVQLLPAVAHDSLAAGAVELSWLVSGAGVGAVAGALVIMTMGAWSRPGLTLVLDALALGVLLIVFAVQRTVPPAVLLSVAVNCAAIVYLGGGGNIVQMTAPDEMRGRVVGLLSMLAHSGTHLGTLIFGVIGSVVGISGALGLAGALVICTALVMLRVPSIREAVAPLASSRVRDARFGV